MMHTYVYAKSLILYEIQVVKKKKAVVVANGIYKQAESPPSKTSLRLLIK